MLLEQIDQDFKTALKEKNEIAVSALRNLKAELTNVQIEKRKELTDEEVTDVVRKKVKQHKDSIESFQKGGRTDLVAHEEGQMAVLVKYLPAQIDEGDLRKIVADTISQLNATQKDFGKVMKEVMTRAKGSTEGNLVSKIVKEQLK
ncbi:MAG: GatB/YqeY domain-containing protein [Candidatus Doudnabacteria bacterium]|nr:GatB/YqeY domain-containing protein [Candidatus Doudnabacteria bacterium]